MYTENDCRRWYGWVLGAGGTSCTLGSYSVGGERPTATTTRVTAGLKESVIIRLRCGLFAVSTVVIQLQKKIADCCFLKAQFGLARLLRILTTRVIRVPFGGDWFLLTRFEASFEVKPRQPSNGRGHHSPPGFGFTAKPPGCYQGRGDSDARHGSQYDSIHQRESVGFGRFAAPV